MMTKQQVAGFMGVSPRTVNNWITARLIPHYRLKGVLRFRSEEIESLLSKVRVPAIGEPKRRAGRIPPES